MSKEEIIAIALVKYGPIVARALFEIFNKDNVSKQDWIDLFEEVQSKSYDDYIKG